MIFLATQMFYLPIFYILPAHMSSSSSITLLPIIHAYSHKNNNGSLL